MKIQLKLFLVTVDLIHSGAHQQDLLSSILSLAVNPFPSRLIYRTALRGGFAHTQFKDPIKTELDGVYCIVLCHIPP